MRSDCFLGEFDQKVWSHPVWNGWSDSQSGQYEVRCQLYIDIFRWNQIGGDCNRQ